MRETQRKTEMEFEEISSDTELRHRETGIWDIARVRKTVLVRAVRRLKTKEGREVSGPQERDRDTATDRQTDRHSLYLDADQAGQTAVTPKLPKKAYPQK